VFQLIFRLILWILIMILVFVALAQWNKVIFMIIPNSYKCDSLLFDSLFFIGASLCIFIVKMVRRKRGFQDQENQANYDPQEKRGSRRLRLIVATSHSVDPKNHPAHPHPLFFTPPQACTRLNLTPAELEFYCNVDHLLTDPTNPQILWHLRRI
jgi:hypothetical protein